jgi:selenide,water dikinase
VLSQLPRLAQERVLVGPETADDAGAVALPDGHALIATVDFITPLVDDPAVYGAIAAANALSDIHAMGSRPVAALSIACFPSKRRPLSELAEILRGGLLKLAEAGTPVIGGHTVEDAEVKFGYAVMGLVQPDLMWRNSTARPGDLLVLTKRLGTGILAAAARARRPVGAAWDGAVAQMQALNRTAAECLDPRSVHAATDISGFGLAGHAAEVARGSRVTLRLRARDLPVLDGALEWARRGYLTQARTANREYVAGALRQSAGIDPALVEVFFDAQTSGGLLLCLDPASDALARLATAGCDAFVVGAVEAPGDAALVLE